MQTAVRINKRMLNAIRNLHTLGFIHRNIQPSNFAIGSQKADTAIVFIIGFSLAARIELDSNGFEIDVPQKLPSRRINTLNLMYMSRRCHSTLNLTRMDDIESWLFSCLEMCMMDCLPWKKCFIASEAFEMKKEFFFHQRKLFWGLTKVFSVAHILLSFDKKVLKLRMCTVFSKL
uniref:Protein kinase domain-containing protein n=1 Tax=Panagrolaimus davidi TaxID=227884 RepID=A0A914PDW5_9BILA